MMKLLLAAAAAALITGCATQQVVPLADTFNEVQASAMLAPGKNVIKGSALMRQQGGGVVTCAGLQVNLIPATDYAKARMDKIYGSTNFTRRGVKFEPDPPGYSAAMRSTTCNAQGFFTFDDLADGEFFLVTIIAWKVGYDVQGGALMGRATVAGGQSKEVTLAR